MFNTRDGAPGPHSNGLRLAVPSTNIFPLNLKYPSSFYQQFTQLQSTNYQDATRHHQLKLEAPESISLCHRSRYPRILDSITHIRYPRSIRLLLAQPSPASETRGVYIHCLFSDDYILHIWLDPYPYWCPQLEPKEA